MTSSGCERTQTHCHQASFKPVASLLRFTVFFFLSNFSLFVRSCCYWHCLNYLLICRVTSELSFQHRFLCSFHSHSKMWYVSFYYTQNELNEAEIIRLLWMWKRVKICEWFSTEIRCLALDSIYISLFYLLPSTCFSSFDSDIYFSICACNEYLWVMWTSYWPKYHSLNIYDVNTYWKRKNTHWVS